MKVANTVELKNKTNELLRTVVKGEPVIITYRGKPAAALTALTEDDLEETARLPERKSQTRKRISERARSFPWMTT